MSSTLRAKWNLVKKDPVIQRSSHTLSVISSGSAEAYVFGGELNPREPRDNTVYAIDLEDSAQASTPGQKSGR